MRASDRKPTRIFLPIAIPAVVSAFVAVAAPVVGAMSSPSPRVGDIIKFSADGSTEKGDRIPVHRRDRFACVLDLGQMRQSGGSLVVEARIPGAEPAYRLHWAGTHTSADAADCGTSADLVVGARDVRALTATISEFATSETGVPIYSEGESK